jgi:hypothetical protein
MNNTTFTSIDKYHEINILIIDNFCYFSIDKITLEYYKSLLLLLKDILLYLYNHKIKFIKQHILSSELLYFKKTISTVNIDTNIVCITTSIDDFMEEICDALNIKHL